MLRMKIAFESQSLSLYVIFSPILRAGVIALPHSLRGIVRFPKDLEQFLEGDFLRMINDADDFGVIRATRTHFVVSGILRVPARVTHL